MFDLGACKTVWLGHIRFLQDVLSRKRAEPDLSRGPSNQAGLARDRWFAASCQHGGGLVSERFGDISMVAPMRELVRHLPHSPGPQFPILRKPVLQRNSQGRLAAQWSRETAVGRRQNCSPFERRSFRPRKELLRSARVGFAKPALEQETQSCSRLACSKNPRSSAARSSRGTHDHSNPHQSALLPHRAAR